MVDLLTSREFQIGVLTGVGGVVAIYLVLLLAGAVFGPWVIAKASGVNIEIPRLIGMRLRRTDPKIVVAAFVRDQKRGGQHSLDVIEAVYIAFRQDVERGGDLLELVDRETARAAAKAKGSV